MIPSPSLSAATWQSDRREAKQSRVCAADGGGVAAVKGPDCLWGLRSSASPLSIGLAVNNGLTSWSGA